MKPGWVALLAFALGCAVSVALWRYWTPQCNEACPTWLALSMQGFALLFPLACAGTGAALAANGRSGRARLIGWVVFAGLAGAVAVWLTQSAR